MASLRHVILNSLLFLGGQQVIKTSDLNQLVCFYQIGHEVLIHLDVACVHELQ